MKKFFTISLLLLAAVVAPTTHAQTTATDPVELTASDSVQRILVTGNKITITFPSALVVHRTLLPAEFYVRINDTVTPVSSVTVTGRDVVLVLTQPVADTDTVIVYYSFLKSSDNSYPLTMGLFGLKGIDGFGAYAMNITGAVQPVTQKLDVCVSSVTFYDDMKIGDRSNQVQELQVILNRLGYTVSVTDGWYGGDTREAIRRLQNDFGLRPSGAVRAATRDVLNSLCFESITVNDTSVLSLGIYDPRVIDLQKSLNRLGFTIQSEPGLAGSIGFETGYYGEMTADAVRRYQKSLRSIPTGTVNAELYEQITKIPFE